MASRARISLSDPADDRPRPVRAAVIALCALCAGIATAHGARGLLAPTSEPPRLPAATATAVTPHAARPTTPQLQDAGHATVTTGSEHAAAAAGAAAPIPDGIPLAKAPDTAPSTDTGLGAVPVPGASGDVANADTAASSVTARTADAIPSIVSTPSADAISGTPSPPSHSRLRFIHGRVAYLRCAGLPQRRGPFPCPRDREFEQQVWSALSALEHCELATGGRSDVRFDFAGDARTWTATGSLERSAVVRCAGAALSRVGTSLRPTRMIVSFRFELR